MTLTLALNGDTHVTLTRRFAAPPARLWAAHTEPALMRRWMTGPDGWIMTRCDIDARTGGTMRCDWARADGGGRSFYVTAEFLDMQPPHRMVHIERMFLPDVTPDNHIETTFAAEGAGTLMTMTMSLPDAESRAAMLATGMTDGMEISYARLESVV